MTKLSATCLIIVGAMQFSLEINARVNHYLNIIDAIGSTLCLKKGCPFYFCNNLGKGRPILIILSLSYSHIYC